jgi:hypothetical protein
MSKNPIVLGIAVVLFAGWMTFLGFKAIRARAPVILSRSQLVHSTTVIEAELNLDASGQLPLSVKVGRILCSNVGDPVGDTLMLSNLRWVDGFDGNGAYLIPLRRKGTVFEVAGLPIDPGFPRGMGSYGVSIPSFGNGIVLHDWREGNPPRPKVYRLTPEVERQWRQIQGGGEQ